MKKISKLLVIVAAVVAMGLVMGCQQPSGGGGGGSTSSSTPSTPATPSTPSTPASPVALSSADDLTVLGSYSSSGATLSFNEDKTGSYTTGSSNIRAAAAIPKFTWSASKDGSNIKITIKYDGKTGTLTRGNSDGKISGNLNDADASNTKIQDFGYDAPEARDMVGTWKLSWPSQGTMDEKLRGDAWYVLSVAFALSGDSKSASAGVRHYNDYGTGIITKDYQGTWSIGNAGANLGYIILKGVRTSDSLLKLSGNKKTAFVYDSYWGMMVFNKQ